MVSPTAVALCHVWLHWRILVPQWFCPYGQCHHQKKFKNNRIAAPVKVARQQTTPKLSWTLRNTGTLRSPTNLPEVASGTYTSTHRNCPEPSEPSEPSGTCLRKLHQHTPELSQTCLRNLHQHTPEPTPAHTGTLRNLPEPASGTYYTSTHRKPTPAHTGTLRNLPELSGTFRNLPPEPAPQTRTGIHRSLSGLKTPLAYAVGEKKKKTFWSAVVWKIRTELYSMLKLMF